MLYKIFPKYLGHIAHNVLGKRRFCCCDKGTRSVPATAKMWWSKTPQRALARLGFYGTRAAERRRSVYRLLCEVRILMRYALKRAFFFFKSGGFFRRFTGAK
jgi:hypothetical protein